MGDIDEIKQVNYRYLRALDTKHWGEFADTLTEDVTGDYGRSIGAELHFTDRDALVQFMRTSLGPEFITEHRVTHPRSPWTAMKPRPPGICRTGSSQWASTSC